MCQSRKGSGLAVLCTAALALQSVPIGGRLWYGYGVPGDADASMRHRRTRLFFLHRISLLVTHRQVELPFVLVLFGFCHSQFLHFVLHSRSRRLKKYTPQNRRRKLCSGYAVYRRIIGVYNKRARNEFSMTRSRGRPPNK